MSNLPEPRFAGVVVLQASSTIQAPIEKVWDVLCNFQSYSEWNEFVYARLPFDGVRGFESHVALFCSNCSHEQIIVDGKTKTPLSDQTPRVGAYMTMEVYIPPSSDLSRRASSRPLEQITALEDDSYRIAWRNCMPSWLVNAERWQALSVTEDGKTLYETREVMGGIGAYLIKWFMYRNLQLGFQAVADGLKKRAEQLQD